MTDPRPPLWKVMRHGYDQSSVPDEQLESADAYDCLADRYGYAAEIEALADAVVPDEPPVHRSRHTISRWARWDQRQEIRRHLLAEAKRAREGRE